jgi:hypothetical protein
MKKVYSKPSVTVVDVRLFGSLLDDDDPNIGLGGNSYETGDGFAKANDEVVEDDDDDFVYTPMKTDWSIE